jgi:hypothetical protein
MVYRTTVEGAWSIVQKYLGTTVTFDQQSSVCAGEAVVLVGLLLRLGLLAACRGGRDKGGRHRSADPLAPPHRTRLDRYIGTVDGKVYDDSGLCTATLLILQWSLFLVIYAIHIHVRMRH